MTTVTSSPRFNSLEEAEEVNSDCTFCGKPKFSVFGIHGPEKSVYLLERCEKQDCTLHCLWDHYSDPEDLTVDLGDEDHVEMVS